MNIWLDTDIGSDVDDAVALLCAIRHPKIRLVGVSTVTHRVEINAWLAQEMLAQAGISSVPVLAGASSPLGGDTGAEDASDWMPSHGRLAPALPRLSACEDAERVEAIAQAMIAITEPYHLLTIGPLTNMGHLLTKHPNLRERWLSVTCMAGSLEKAEYNVEQDIKAARIAIGLTSPTLVGLEASSYTLGRDEAEAALDPADPPAAFLLDCYREYRGHNESAPMTLYDAITLMQMVRPELFTLQQMKLVVGGDGRLHSTDDGSPVTYATDCDWGAVKKIIIGLLRGTP